MLRGNALMGQAKVKGNTPEGDSLFAEAGRKYAEALRIKPDKHEAYNNWGTALSAQAKLKGNTPEGDSLFAEAGRKYAEALRLEPKDALKWFNFACLAGLLGNAGECVSRLGEWKRFDSAPTAEKLDRDSDFDNVRTDPGFVAFRATLPSA